jgi:hypothetical protein
MTGETITSTASASGAQRRSSATAFAGGAVIGALGGLIGLGGAEFRIIKKEGTPASFRLKTARLTLKGIFAQHTNRSVSSELMI